MPRRDPAAVRTRPLDTLPPGIRPPHERCRRDGVARRLELRAGAHRHGASLFLLFGREAWHLVSVSQEPVHLLSGMYFPVRRLGTVKAAGVHLRSFLTAAWLGWQIESNWTKPLLFAVYSVVKPLALAGILVVLYGTITGGQFEAPMFAYMYIGNAFYMYVGAVMTGMAYAVIDDRERYQTLKSIYVAPVTIPGYLAGRGVARFVTGTSSVAITLLAGVVVLGLPVRPLAMDWPLFLAALAIGLVMLAMLGLLLASVVLLMPHQSWSMGDGVAGALYLFSGAIFPLSVLPAALQPIGDALPLTYWLELLRRALVGHVADAFPTLAGLSDGTLLGILGLSTALLTAAALATTVRRRGAGARPDRSHEDDRQHEGVFAAASRPPRLTERCAMRRTGRAPRRGCQPPGTAPGTTPRNSRHYLTYQGATPFYLAARNGDARLMRVLLEGGADPTRPTRFGVTPLMAAA